AAAAVTVSGRRAITTEDTERKNRTTKHTKDTKERQEASVFFFRVFRGCFLFFSRCLLWLILSSIPLSPTSQWRGEEGCPLSSEVVPMRAALLGWAVALAVPSWLVGSVLLLPSLSPPGAVARAAAEEPA